jgi:hypothetical protein
MQFVQPPFITRAAAFLYNRFFCATPYNGMAPPVGKSGVVTREGANFFFNDTPVSGLDFCGPVARPSVAMLVVGNLALPMLGIGFRDLSIP